MRRARMEPKGLPGLGRHRDPVEGVDDVGVDAAALVHGKELMMLARDHLETAVLDRRVVDCDHARHVTLDEAIRRRVLMRRVAGTSRQLVVDLLLVEHRLLTQQRRRSVEQRPSRQQRAAARRGTG